jgi:outer membrane protein OmpA-like peptidoglycan-associated protein/tetratricopeptide (TPR) repeat protein
LLLWIAAGNVWATEIQEQAGEPLFAQKGSCFERSIGAFAAELEQDADELLMTFYSGVAAQQCALESSDRYERQSLLEQAAGHYRSYLESNPKASGAANNLAKVYEELGQFELAQKFYKIAIAVGDSYRGLYLHNYAESLDKRDRWQEASQVYSIIIEEQYLTPDQREVLTARYAERGIDELAGYLWELLDAGDSMQIAKIALTALADDSDIEAQTREELMGVVSVALSRSDFGKEHFAEPGLPELLVALRDDPVIGEGIYELEKVFAVTRKILAMRGINSTQGGGCCDALLRLQQLEPGRFRWWSSRGNPKSDPLRGVWPVDGFRALVRSLGELMNRTAATLEEQGLGSDEYVQFAERYYRLAANLRPSDVDPMAVRDLIRLKLWEGSLSEVQLLKEEYQDSIQTAENTPTNTLKKTFEYRKSLGGVYTKLSDRNPTDVSIAKEAADQLREAQQISDQIETRMRELPKHYEFSQELSDGLNRVSKRLEPPPPPPTPDPQYIGDDLRIGFGYDSETDLTGEIFWNFLESPTTAYSVEGWKGNERSGGLKFNFHWLADGVLAGKDLAGEPVYSDGKVRKLFVAADQNIFEDAKVTVGGGSELEERFWALYASKSITGERLLSRSLQHDESRAYRTSDNHRIIDTTTVTTTTELFAHPYDWGIGFRLGRFFDNGLVRLNGGFDYEWGEYSAYQLTGYAGVEKRFANSSHGLSFRAEVLRKDGDFEIDDSDVRLSAYWSWDFGTNSRQLTEYQAAQPAGLPDTSDRAVEASSGTVGKQVTLSFDDDESSFELDSHELTEGAKIALKQALADFDSAKVIGKILVIGHTCSLGSEAHNQQLSEDRAQAVYDFLVKQGVDSSLLCKEGRGESEPRYPNDTEKSMSRNRRVEITFTTQERVPYDNVLGDVQPVSASVRQETPTESTWIRRALRNPVTHKRSVDYYRFNRIKKGAQITSVLLNTGPSAQDDEYDVCRNSDGATLPILANDSDPEQDFLDLFQDLVSPPQHGAATVTGDSVRYIPEDDYLGEDSFTYRIVDRYVAEPHDPGEPSQATVRINVVDCRPEPEDDWFEVSKYPQDVSLPVLENDSDPNEYYPLSILADSITPPVSGGSVYPNQMTIRYMPAVPRTPGVPENCTDTFTYAIENAKGHRSERSATVHITVMNDLPMAMDDRAVTARNAPVTIDMLANDEDDDDLTIVSYTQPTRLRGQVTRNANGTLTYTPDGRYWGEDTFRYTVRDYCGEESTATVTVVVENKEIPVPSPGPS